MSKEIIEEMDEFDILACRSSRNASYLKWKHAVIHLGGILGEKPYHFPLEDEAMNIELYEYGTSALDFWDKEEDF